VEGAEDEVLSMAMPGQLPASSAAVSDRVSRSEGAYFDRLFEEFSGPIYNYALRMVGDPDRCFSAVGMNPLVFLRVLVSFWITHPLALL